MIRFEQLPDITTGHILALSDSQSWITNLLIDSRKVSVLEGTVFFAIRGDRHDGHQYIQDLYIQGIRQFVVEHPVAVQDLPGCNIYQVSSCIVALQHLAAHHRARFHIPVIGLTGSNGKTIIKEWLFQMLSRDKVVVKNPGSYNSQIGVPLSVWQLQDYHEIGIFEAGISRTGEMDKLEQVMRPTIGIFTNLGSAHDEGFASRDEKVAEKLKLFRRTDVVIYNAGATAIHTAVQNRHLRSFTWGHTGSPDVKVEQADRLYTVHHGNVSFTLTLPFADSASVENALHAVALMLYLGYQPEVIAERVSTLRSVSMRLELKEGINQCQVIDDTYNNDLGGLEISLQFLSHQHQKSKKTLILSDILESGQEEEALVRSVASRVLKHGVHRFIGIGPVLHRHQSLFGSQSDFYLSTEEFLEHFDNEAYQHEVILVKGARAFRFERIVARLQRKVHGTTMEIDLNALVHNFNFFKSRLKPTTRVMVMVKAFAYGSGSNEIASLLQYHRADYLGVAYTDEGVELRKHNISLPIMVMNPSEDSFDQIVQYKLEPEIYSFNILDVLIRYLQGRPCTIHLKLDTGMHRLGFTGTEIQEVIRRLRDVPNIRVATIFSHLAGADETRHDDFSQTQATQFLSWADAVSAGLGYKPLYHILNSPGILRLPQYQFDMVRLGIGLYGVDPTEAGVGQGLRPVATLKTMISQIKSIPQGESIGYGRRGMANQDMVIGTIAIGYADGFSRAFSRGVGQVWVNGRLAPIVGNVCMDMSMIDLTDIPAREGDEVIIFGKTLPIQQVAASIQTIPYEILTNTSERVKRVFVAEGI